MNKAKARSKIENSGSGRVSPFMIGSTYNQEAQQLSAPEEQENINILNSPFVREKENSNQMPIEQKYKVNSLLVDITNTQQQMEKKAKASMTMTSALHPTSSNKNRLIITKIVLENFKSYQGVQTIGPFHKRFTAVVGPNGSGKSNLIESLLFVFGKRASWMRLKKLNELIHNSHQHQDVRKASVEVHFQEIEDTGEGDLDYVLLSGTDFSVKRSVYHTSVSKYEINNRESSQVDVVEMLKSKGIDLNNNRFLILQGEVEQISLMKPKSNDVENPGLLEYLEDIIGSNANKEKIENLEGEYEKMQGEKRERTERVRFAEDELKKLDESKNVAIQYVKKEKTIFQMTNLVHQIDRHASNKELMKNEQLQEQLAQKVKEEQKNQKEKIREHESAIKEYNKRIKARDDLKKREKELEAIIKKIENEDMKIKNEISQELQSEIKTKEEIDNLSKSYRKIIDTSNEMKKLLPERRQQLASLAAAKDEEEKKLNEIIYKVNKQGESIRNQSKKVEVKMEPYVKEVAKIGNKLDVLNSEYNLLNSKRADYQQDINDLITKIEKINQELEANKIIENQIQIATDAINRELAKAGSDKESLNQEMNSYNLQINEVKNKLSEHNQTHREQERRNVVLNELLKAQQRKELSGICGRLGDLGAIDPRYDVAISSACPALENIVVETYDQAQRCVDYLKHHKIGRATFLNLQSNSKFENTMNNPFTAPKGSMRLFDLIKFKKAAYAPVFYSALTNTLVCDDIERATQLCYHDSQRWRCVTIQGVVMDKSGVMSGGGRPKSGGMSSKISQDAMSPAELKALSDEHERLEREKGKISEGLKVLDERMNELRTDMEQVNKEHKRLSIETDFHNSQIKDNEEKLKEYRRIMSSANNNEGEKKAQIERDINEYMRMKKQQEDNMADFKNELRRLEDQLSEIGGEELIRQKAIVEEKNRLFNELDKEVGKMVAMIESTGRNLKKLEKDEEASKKRLEDVMKNIENLKERQKTLENEVLLAIGEVRGVKEKRETVDNELKSNEAEKRRIEKIVTEIKASLEKINSDYEVAKANFKKSREDYEKANIQIEKNRKNYKETTQQYDFLDELEEIAKFKMDGVSASPNKNDSMLDMSLNQSTYEIAAGVSDISMEQIPQRKKLKVNIDKHFVESIEVNVDLPFEELETVEKYKETLNFKLAFENEKLNSLQPNINAIMEFKKKYFDFKEKFLDLEKVRETMTHTKESIEQLKKERYDQFIAGYNSINFKLKETYQLLTYGGDAELELLDSLDPFSEGVVFSVRPPKKSWKQMNKLSGGEKTLSSLALVFALHYYRPTPLYFMDEIDAALDYKNVSIVGKYLKERTKNAQFIIISLRNNMFELANKLVGIYKINDTTKTISLNPNDVSLEQAE